MKLPPFYTLKKVSLYIQIEFKFLGEDSKSNQGIHSLIESERK
jgi:hypothetical protein